MVRCGFVCYCMFDWLVGFHNLISAWADMRILEVFHLVVNSFCDELR